MEIKKAGSQASTKGAAEWFTGAVRVDPLFQAPEPARVAGGSVTFEPGARTNWHTHPLGQTLPKHSLGHQTTSHGTITPATTRSIG